MKNNMIKETKSELKKVIWPTKKDVVNGTVVVAVMVIIVGIIILVFDFISSALVTKIISDEDISISDIFGGEDGNEDSENIENSENPENPENSVENSEPTIENNEVTE